MAAAANGHGSGPLSTHSSTTIPPSSTPSPTFLHLSLPNLPVLIFILTLTASSFLLLLPLLSPLLPYLPYLLPLLLLLPLHYHFFLCLPPTVHHRAWVHFQPSWPPLPPSPPSTSPSALLTRSLLTCPSPFTTLLSSPFRPTPYLFNGHLQTVFTAFAPPSLLPIPAITYHRHLLHVSPSLPHLHPGILAIDWPLPPPFSPPYLSTDPTVILCHGLAGGSGETYIKSTIQHFHSLPSTPGPHQPQHYSRFRCVVVNQRGCGGTELISPQAYCAAYTTDLALAISHIHRALPHSPLLLVGFSLGANLVTKLASELPPSTPVVACVAVSNPWDLLHSSRTLDSAWWRRWTYSRRLASSMTSLFHHHAPAFAHTLDMQRVLSARTLREFDTAFTAPSFGYPCADAYYRDASSAGRVPGIAVPCMFVSARDDPICTVEAVPVAECEGNEGVLLVTVAGGGHSMQFFEGWKARPWAVRLTAEYATAVMAELRKQGRWKEGVGEEVAQPPPGREAKGELVQPAAGLDSQPPEEVRAGAAKEDGDGGAADGEVAVADTSTASRPSQPQGGEKDAQHANAQRGGSSASLDEALDSLLAVTRRMRLLLMEEAAASDAAPFTVA